MRTGSFSDQTYRGNMAFVVLLSLNKDCSSVFIEGRYGVISAPRKMSPTISLICTDTGTNMTGQENITEERNISKEKISKRTMTGKLN